MNIGTFGGISDDTIVVTTLATTTKLVAFVGIHQGTIDNVTLNGVSLNFRVRAATAFNETMEIWDIDNPGALTSVNLVVSYSGGSGPAIGYINLEKSSTGAPDNTASNTGTSSGPSVSITPNVNNCIILAAKYAEEVCSATSDNEIFRVTANYYESSAANYYQQGSKANKTMSFTIASSQRFAAVAVSIAPDQQPPTPSFRLNVNGGTKLKPRPFGPGIAR